MQTDTFEQALLEFLTATRFEEFGIQLATSVVLVIRHPETIRVDGDLVRFLESDGSDHLFDASSVVRVFSAIGPRDGEDDDDIPE